jgi:ketosteroid isomerase-like protein
MRTGAVTLDETLERFRGAANAMARGDAEAVKGLYSHADDVTLANPFGHAVKGWADVAAALDYVAGRFPDGEVTEFRNIARYEAADLATFLDVEHWRTSVGGGDPSDFELRVSSTYPTRTANGSWSIVTPIQSRRSTPRVPSAG